MRVHGRARIDARKPSALGVCDRCGFHYNLKDLTWQFQWVGPRQQNIRLLVCESCYDTPQEQLRSIILPVDPEPIQNARPENYVNADNPMSQQGVSANWQAPQYGSMIGNLTAGGGLNAAVDGNPAKIAATCASNTISNSSYSNWVGVNWQGSVANLAMTTDLLPPVVKHSLLGFTITSPVDRGFLGSVATNYVIQGAAVPAAWATWTTISSGTTSGTAGETISSTCAANGLYQFHRVAFEGDQLNYVAIAQFSLDVAQVGEPE